MDKPLLKHEEREGGHQLPREAFPVGAVRHAIQVGDLPTLDEDHRQDLSGMSPRRRLRGTRCEHRLLMGSGQVTSN